ncbi:transposase domain-containing protein [Bradyrhizobium sp. I1.7.5]|uniref:transposase domain-containing protein n=1 Tax=Bradyrhizobium sp. I1.7.5 TaxID=3156363 RepID=UPI0033967517
MCGRDEQWLAGRRTSLLPAEVIKYALNHCDGPKLLRRNGRVVESNTVEGITRPIAVVRRNSLFSGSGGRHRELGDPALIVNTAKLHDLDPRAYLADVLRRFVSGRTNSHQLRAARLELEGGALAYHAGRR